MFDAKLWVPSSLRIYMMLGPPGVGKSEFTVWLAGQLRLPIYRRACNARQIRCNLMGQFFVQTDTLVSNLSRFETSHFVPLLINI